MLVTARSASSTRVGHECHRLVVEDGVMTDDLKNSDADGLKNING